MNRKRKAMQASERANDLGPRWAYLLREQVYPGPHKAKRIAQEWGVSIGLAKVWLAGGRPTSEQIARAHGMWGANVLHVLFGRVPVQSVVERLSAVEQEIAALKSGAESHVENHRQPHDAVSHLASGGERAPGSLVGPRPKPRVVENKWRLWRALKAEAERKVGAR